MLSFFCWNAAGCMHDIVPHAMGRSEPMRAIFLSDAHLRGEDADNYHFLLQFFTDLQKEAEQQRKGRRDGSTLQRGEGEPPPLDALFLLGDFFDFWFAKGERCYPGFERIIRLIREIGETGVKIYLFEGNHDFFLDDYFARGLGVTVHQDHATIDLDGYRIYAAHGDLVDQSNRGYLFLRKFLRSRFFYQLQRIIPSRLLWRIALVSSDTSKALWAQTGKMLTDKMCRFALGLGEQGYDGIILGHSHHPLVWAFSVSGEKKVLVTLGDWLTHRSYLEYSNRCFSMKYYKNEKLQDQSQPGEFCFE